MDESKQTDSRGPGSDSGQGFAARRRVVKGMASAVPVIMTIGSGQAMAQASTLCIDKPIIQPAHCINDDQSDDYVREPSTEQECSDTDPGSFYGAEPDDSLEDNKKRLVYVDQDGDPTSSSAGKPVTVSCYASFIGTSGG